MRRRRGRARAPTRRYDPTASDDDDGARGARGSGRGARARATGGRTRGGARTGEGTARGRRRAGRDEDGGARAHARGERRRGTAAGGDGGGRRKVAAYGHTKAGMSQLAKTMAVELKDVPIGVHTISPGMVFTELISSGRDAFGSQGRMFVNALAEPAEVAAEQIVDKLKVATVSPDSVNKTIAIKILTPDVALRKMFGRFVLGENRDRFQKE